MYCYDFICTYKLIDEEFRDILYKQQLLDAFKLQKYDAAVIKNGQEFIYNRLKLDENFIRILEKIKKKYPQLCFNNMDSLNILFSYDYFDLFHRYLIDCFMNKEKEIYYYNKLIDAIN